MDRPFYNFKILQNTHRFEFESVGKRSIKKVILYQETTLDSFYNLTLADLLPDGSTDIESISNNGDMPVILATIAQSIMIFLKTYPFSRIAFSGSSESRTRLYQIAISKELDGFSNLFTVYGFYNDEIKPFERNKNYQGFVITSNSSKLAL